MAIITISRQLGSLGTEIAKGLQKELKFNLFDKESLEEGLVSKYGMPEDKVRHYDERKPAFWDMFSTDKERYLSFMKTMMYGVARQGHCIIMGRGGQVLFRNIPGSLHVRVIAPIECRINRVKKSYNDNEHVAKLIIQNSDHDRAGFHKFFFNVDNDDPGLYDLTINTRKLETKTALDLIKSTVISSGIMDLLPEESTELEDMSLSQDVYRNIVYTENIPVCYLKVTVSNGVVTLNGGAHTVEDTKLCGVLVARMDGVKDVVNELQHIPAAYNKF